MLSRAFVNAPVKADIISTGICIDYLPNVASLFWAGEVFNWLKNSSHMLLFCLVLRRVQTNWKPLGSKIVSMDQGNGSYSSQ